jgi:hypothetical protein
MQEFENSMLKTDKTAYSNCCRSKGMFKENPA